MSETRKRRHMGSNGLAVAEPNSFINLSGVHPWETHNDTTVLTPEMEARFQEWVKQQKIRDVDLPDSNYDYRGAWLAGMSADPKADMHWPDQFKQHGHETFSNESQYARGPYDAGHWEGDKYVYPPPAPPIDIDVTSREMNRPVDPEEEAMRMRAASRMPTAR